VIDAEAEAVPLSEFETESKLRAVIELKVKVATQQSQTLLELKAVTELEASVELELKAATELEASVELVLKAVTELETLVELVLKAVTEPVASVELVLKAVTELEASDDIEARMEMQRGLAVPATVLDRPYLVASENH